MAWLALDKGKEVIYDRDETRDSGAYFSFIELPAGSIEKLTGIKPEKLKEPYNLHNGRI
jgi:hypothetical protein